MLEELWHEAGQDPDSDGDSDSLRSAIRGVLSPSAQIAQKYALITQLLIKEVMRVPDSKQLAGFGDDDFTARSFAKYTTANFAPLSQRIGGSSDPYVSNPLRTPSLRRELEGGRGGTQWASLFEVLDLVDEDLSLARGALLFALRQVHSWPAQGVRQKVAPRQDRAASDLHELETITALSTDVLLDMLEVLESGQPQLILAGPPGTSKTHTALALAAYLSGGDEALSTVVQLHATYGYEEFIEGLRPEVDRDSGGVVFRVSAGVVRRVAAACEDSRPRFLILDEMNRANLPRVFGELFYALERRGEPIDLLYTNQFKLPSQIAFIGTMNTADRSIRSIDAALRRRFSVFELPPSIGALEKFYETRPNEVADLSGGFLRLNVRLSEMLDRHHTVGHTFLMDERGMTAGRLDQIWARQIYPLIEDYLFDMPSELSAFSAGAFWEDFDG